MSTSPCRPPAKSLPTPIAATGRPIYEPPSTKDRCRGWKDIAARLEATSRLYDGKDDTTLTFATAQRYSRLPCDPLPIRTYRGEAWCRTHRIDEWIARRMDGVLPNGTPLTILRGWADIRVALGNISHSAAVRWATGDNDPLPISGRWLPGSTGSVWMYTTALRDWYDRHDLPIQAVDVRCQDVRKVHQKTVDEVPTFALGLAMAGNLIVGRAAQRMDIDESLLAHNV